MNAPKIAGTLFLIVSIAVAQSGVVIPLPSEKPDPNVLSLAEMNVDILIDNQHATVKVMKIFDNHTERTLEGKYLFALQPRSSISDFAVWDNETRIPGVMMEKRRANQIYGQIKQRRVDPGILQTTDGADGPDSSATGFSAKIFPINAYGTKRLEMEYTEVLPVQGLTSHFMFPLKPSYGEAQTVGEFNLRLRVVSDLPIEPLQRDDNAFPLQVTRSEPNEYAAEYHAQNLQLTNDLSFDYRVAVEGDAAFSVVTHRAPERVSAYDLRDPRTAEADPDGFFEARSVFASEPEKEQPPRRVIMLLDTSLSMYGDKLARAVEATDFFLHSLNRNDQFDLMLFNDETVPFSPQPVAGTKDNVELAMQFVRNSSIGGGTNMKRALEKAVEQSAKFTDGQPSIVLVSDANPTLETGKITSIANVLDKHDARVFAFGIGNDADQPLMKELSERTHGYFDSARETEDIGLKLKLFFDKVGASDISGFDLISTDTANLHDVYPSAGDSYPGSSLSFVGRYKKPETATTITLNAKKGEENVSLSKQVDLPDLEAAHEYLPRVWAQARIDALLAAMNRDGEREDYIDEIIRLSEKYKIVTPYTAFLAAPRSLLRPRLIEPGDPVIRVKTDPSVTNVVAVLPFGETLPMKFLASEGVWEGRFLAPDWMVDGTYQCRLLLTDKDGNGYQEQKSFVIDSRAPKVKIGLDKKTYSAGESVRLSVSSDSDTYRLVARVYGAKPAELRWSPQDKTNVGELQIPPDLVSGRYTVSVTAEDFAHNQTTEEVQIEVIGK